jgi:hypothetical protein
VGAARAADLPRLAGAWRSLSHAMALRGGPLERQPKGMWSPASRPKAEPYDGLDIGRHRSRSRCAIAATPSFPASAGGRVLRAARSGAARSRRRPQPCRGDRCRGRRPRTAASSRLGCATQYVRLVRVRCTCRAWRSRSKLPCASGSAQEAVRTVRRPWGARVSICSRRRAGLDGAWRGGRRTGHRRAATPCCPG